MYNANPMNGLGDSRASSISKARTLDEIVDFWDTHSVADYWDQTEEVEIEVRAQRRHRVTLTPEVDARVEAQARLRGLAD